jgi:DNA topoisomerase I
MAVESFMKISDAKQTVEKLVKPKPKLQDLVTIESPGKPVPATSLEDNKKPKRKSPTRKKPTSTKVKVEKVRGDSTFIITEKPQSADKIAHALGSPKKYTESGVSYFEVEKDGKNIIVASAVGHLFNLEYKKGQKGWPIFDIEWRPSYEKKSSAFTKRYYNLLKKLSRQADEVIVATDYDIEGEVIGWNVLRYIFGRETAKRMKYSTLTKNELLKSFENPMPELDWGQAYAGETRHILDWLYGINMSRALMSAIKTTGSFKILSIGRVQGPALKIIVDREHEIAKFKPEPYWQALALIDGFEFKHPKDIFDKKELDKFKDIKSGDAKTVESEEAIQPPAPFDLTSLQREAYNLHKIGPSQSLAIAQKLYLDGLISYPRTSSQKIPDTIEPKKILKALENNFPEVKEAVRQTPVEGAKSDPAHPSIYPTGEHKQLNEEELKIYNLIVKRFISVFAKDAITSNTRVTITSDKDPEIKFKASGLKIKEKGWTKVYPSSMEESDVPKLNGKVNIDELKFPEKETQPPRRYTPASLVTTLEKKNLGTKATRSMIIDTLFNRGYLDGRSIQATPLGMKLIESLEKYSPIIIDENLTRQLEEEMESILQLKTGLNEKKDVVVGKATRLITDISKEFKAKELEIGKGILGGLTESREIENQNNTIIACPTCKKGNLRIMFSRKSMRSFIGCSNYPECKQTYSLPPNSLIKKSDKICPDCNYPRLLSIKKGKRPWDFCFNPECPDNKKRREEWEARKAAGESKTNAEVKDGEE